MPLKGCSLWIVHSDIFINSLAYLAGRSEASSLKRLSPKDTKPAFYLVKPGSMGRRKMKVYIGMTLQPTVLFGLMGTQVIKHYMDFLIRLIGNNLIHKIQKLPAPAAGIVASLHHSSGHV